MTAESFYVSEEDTQKMGAAATAYLNLCKEVLANQTPEGWPPHAFRAAIVTRVLVTALCMPTEPPTEEKVDDVEMLLGATAGIGQLIGILEPANERAQVTNAAIQQLVSTIAATASISTVEPTGTIQ